jgi:transcriptional regulator NrdR family protein
MICPYCGSNQIRVMDTMPGEEEIYRRKKCRNCCKIFRTKETRDDGSTEFSAGYYYAMKRKKMGEL